MRYVDLSLAQEGMVLAKSLYTNEGAILLSEGKILSVANINTLRDYGLNGVYVSLNKGSVEKTAIHAITDTLKNKAVSSAKSFFHLTSHSRSEEFAILQALVFEIVENILSDENLIYNLIDLKLFDDYTYHHSVNVAVLSIILGVNIGLTKEELKELGVSAIIHDIGKVFVPASLLNKQGTLTDDEFETMKLHVQEGVKFASEGLRLSKKVCEGIADHHEKWDGSGYPCGKKGSDISLFGRIISVADVYDALASNRPYRAIVNASDVFEYVISMSGSHFDPLVVGVFFDNVAPYPIGTSVVLSNGEVGVVVKNHKRFLLRPDVMVGEVIYSLKNDMSLMSLTIKKIYVDVA